MSSKDKNLSSKDKDDLTIGLVWKARGNLPSRLDMGFMHGKRMGGARGGVDVDMDLDMGVAAEIITRMPHGT